jgi:hypothetical protein
MINTVNNKVLTAIKEEIDNKLAKHGDRYQPLYPNALQEDFIKVIEDGELWLCGTGNRVIATPLLRALMERLSIYLMDDVPLQDLGKDHYLELINGRLFMKFQRILGSYCIADFSS